MSIIPPLLIVALIGLFGGIINVLLTDTGFRLPGYADKNRTVFVPGFLGNILIGITAAVASWALYGPAAGYVIYPQTANRGPYVLTLTGALSALFIAIGGARWLTSEVDKRLLRAAAVAAADDPDTKQEIAAATPAKALDIAKQGRSSK
jgi:hypothetical protein